MNFNQVAQAVLPAGAQTPLAEADSIQTYAASQGLTFTVEFSSTEGEVRISLGHDAEALAVDEQSRITKLTEVVLDAEFGDWRAAPGITGQLIIDREGFFLKGDDLREDWTFERSFDIDDLAFQDWVAGDVLNDPGPAPA